MRIFFTVLASTALLAGCAQARAPAPDAIADAEPDVRRQLGALLAQLAAGTPAREQLTDKAALALQPAQLAAALRTCPMPPPLQLLARTTKGEDRNYLYRAACDGTPLLVEVSFNKAAKVDRLAVRPER